MDRVTSFGQALKQRRRARDLTQQQLAHQVGCAAVTIQRIEQGTLRPSRQVLERLAAILELPPKEREGFVRLARTGPLPGASEPQEQPASSVGAEHTRSVLPVQTTPFIGREQELTEIRRLLLDEPDCRLVNLFGPGGIGKTRLALAAARQTLDAFPDGVYLVSLAPVGEAALIVLAIAEALRFTFYSRTDPKDQLLDYLSQKQLLVVVDNFEHLLDDAELL